MGWFSVAFAIKFHLPLDSSKFCRQAQKKRHQVLVLNTNSECAWPTLLHVITKTMVFNHKTICHCFKSRVRSFIEWLEERLDGLFVREGDDPTCEGVGLINILLRSGHLTVNSCG